MKIIIEEITNINETEIIVKCKERTDDIDNIVDTLKLFDKTISGKKDKETYIIKPADIFYFDSANDKVFCYTKDDVYETNYKLYEIEQIFQKSTYLRVNKNIVLNINKIKSFKSSFNGRIEATLLNGEMVEISRNYVPALKQKLGGKI